MSASTRSAERGVAEVRGVEEHPSLWVMLCGCG